MKCEVYGCRRPAAVKVEQSYGEEKATVTLCRQHATAWLKERPKTARVIKEYEGRKS